MRENLLTKPSRLFLKTEDGLVGSIADVNIIRLKNLIKLLILKKVPSLRELHSDPGQTGIDANKKI